MPSPKIAVIMFPGTNCEQESARAVISAGMTAEIIRWNSPAKLDDYDGFVLPGGFSYEDRIRAGIIAAQESIMSDIKRQADLGKPVIGICNGAQILVESGIIPGLKNKVEMALAPNINPFVSGYYCTWVYLRSTGKSAFNSLFSPNEIFPVPVAHGEGRFVTRDKELIETLKKNNQIIFWYCDGSGEVIEKFPINPNGSSYNIAAVSNEKGNVLAIMPHPERASFKRQIPNLVKRDIQEAESHAEGIKVFESMKLYIESQLFS